jgi:hypothetical protein
VADTETETSQEDETTTQDGGNEEQNTDKAESKSEVDQATEKHLGDLRKENASWRTKLRKAEGELSKLKESSSSEIEQARAEARQEALTEATAEANKRIVRAEVIAAGAGKLQDPTDAIGHLDLDKFEVNENGEVDRKALTAAVDELLKSKPYLGATRDPEFGKRPTATGGKQNMNDLIKQRLRR